MTSPDIKKALDAMLVEIENSTDEELQERFENHEMGSFGQMLVDMEEFSNQDDDSELIQLLKAGQKDTIDSIKDYIETHSDRFELIGLITDVTNRDAVYYIFEMNMKCANDVFSLLHSIVHAFTDDGQFHVHREIDNSMDGFLEPDDEPIYNYSVKLGDAHGEDRKDINEEQLTKLLKLRIDADRFIKDNQDTWDEGEFVKDTFLTATELEYHKLSDIVLDQFRLLFDVSNGDKENG